MSNNTIIDDVHSSHDFLMLIVLYCFDSSASVLSLITGNSITATSFCILNTHTHTRAHVLMYNTIMYIYVSTLPVGPIWF